MKSELKKELITACVLLILIGGFILVGIFGLKKRDKQLKQNPEYGYAIIVDTYLGAKAKDYVRYEFIVDGKIYDGHQGYMPHLQSVNIGDTCEVVYAKSNPEISRLLTDENKFLKIK